MAMASWQKGLSVVASISALGMLLAGCGATNNTVTNGTPTTGATGTPVEGGNIMLDTNSNFKDLDPALAYDTTSNEAVNEMYDQLVTYSKDTSNIVGLLADTYTVSPDGLTYTFKIKQGVKFWNGDPLTAQSFIDEFQRVLSPTVGSPGEGFLDPIVQGSTAYNKGTAKAISGITAPDPNTLVIKLNKPEPFFLEVLAMPFFSAVDQSFINTAGKKFDSSEAMGTGPFQLKSFDGNTMVLAKNPNYFLKDASGNQLPYLNKITITVNKNTQVDGLHFEQGQTAIIGNLFSGIPSDIYPHFVNTPALAKDIITAPENATYYIGLNSKMKPFDNTKVRQAMEYAIDKSKIVKLLNNRAIAANQPLPPGIKGYVSGLDADATYTYDPAKAKQLLAAAGFANGFTTDLYSANDADDIKIDTSIQNDLAQIGVTAKIHSMDWNSYLTLNEKGQTPMFSLAWIQDFPDASDFLNTLFNTTEQPANNSSMYSNPQVDQWLNQAQTDTNATERYQLYTQATNQIMKDAPWVPLYYTKYEYAVQSWVHGYFINQSIPNDSLQYVWIDQSHSQG